MARSMTASKSNEFRFGRCGAVLLLVPAFLMSGGCGDDEDESGQASERVAQACDESCQVTLGECNLPEQWKRDCDNVCQLGSSLVPDCSDPYGAYVECTRDRPLIRCEDSDITVSVSVPACIDPLANYLACAIESLATPCLAVPLQDGECIAAGLGPQAYACVGQRDGCQLFEGTSRAGGFGLFCCG